MHGERDLIDRKLDLSSKIVNHAAGAPEMRLAESLDKEHEYGGRGAKSRV
jgi:hypothetical protein